MQLVSGWGMSLGAVARKAARQIIHEASIKIPPAVQVTKAADQLSFKGPLGTSHLGLSGIDTLGDAAIRLCPESREIAICSPSKGFFGTLQVNLDHRRLGFYHHVPSDDTCCHCLLVCLHGSMGASELQVKASYAGGSLCTACMLRRWSTFLSLLPQSLLQNKIEGVTKGVLVYLRIVGIGYRASLSEQTLTFKLGYSHDVTYELPGSMRAFLPEPTLVGLYGIDKNQVSNIPRLQLLHAMRYAADCEITI